MLLMCMGEVLLMYMGEVHSLGRFPLMEFHNCSNLYCLPSPELLAATLSWVQSPSPMILEQLDPYWEWEQWVEHEAPALLLAEGRPSLQC